MALANAVLMVEPRDFGFNHETAADNAFQHHPDAPESVIRTNAVREFWGMVELLDKHHLDVMTQESPADVIVPDAVFPNNWFSTTETSLLIYPMKTANRQQEVQIQELSHTLETRGYKISETLQLSEEGHINGVLEGTGVLVFDHDNATIYANISERCESDALTQYATHFGFDVWPLEAVTSMAVPVYHTNVLLAIGTDFAVIASDTLTPSVPNNRAMQALREHKQDVIEINEQQMVEGMCGNILQLQSSRGEPLIVMSDSARKSFTTDQILRLERHGSLVAADIATIEYVGGGSARCMLAEIFLQKA